jgi:hypothetical protein
MHTHILAWLKVMTLCLLTYPSVALQISNAFKPEHEDVEYAQGKYMLQMLGLQVRRCLLLHVRLTAGEQWDTSAVCSSAMVVVGKHCASQRSACPLLRLVFFSQKFENNLKKGQLTDNTIMLWNDRYSKILEGPMPWLVVHRC